MYFKQSLLALMAVVGAIAQDDTSSSASAPVLKADISTTFPEADIFGVKLVNGRPTNALVEITNHESGPIRVAFVAGSLISTKDLPAEALFYQSIVRNLTAVQYNIEVDAGEKKSLSYAFALDMQPQDVKVQLIAVVSNDKGEVFKVPASNDKASIVEAPVNFFDMQIIFLYLVLSGVFAGALYFVYKTWIEALFPAPKRAPKTPKKAEIAIEPVGVSTSSKSYDESWIPEHHINPPSARRVKSGAIQKTKKSE